MPGQKVPKCLSEGHGKGLKKNDKGEFIQWTAQSRDGHDLKIYVENGCTDGYTPKDVREKFPQFKKYTYSAFNGALTNVRKSFNNSVRNRGVKNCTHQHYIYHFAIIPLYISSPCFGLIDLQFRGWPCTISV